MSNINLLNFEQQMRLFSTCQQLTERNLALQDRCQRLETDQVLLQARDAFLQARIEQLSQIETKYASAQQQLEKKFSDLRDEVNSFAATEIRGLNQRVNDMQMLYQTQVIDLVVTANDALSKKAQLVAENEQLKRELEANRFSASLLSPDPESRLSANTLPSPSPTNE